MFTSSYQIRFPIEPKRLRPRNSFALLTSASEGRYWRPIISRCSGRTSIARPSLREYLDKKHRSNKHHQILLRLWNAVNHCRYVGLGDLAAVSAISNGIFVRPPEWGSWLNSLALHQLNQTSQLWIHRCTAKQEIYNLQHPPASTLSPIVKKLRYQNVCLWERKNPKSYSM